LDLLHERPSLAWPLERDPFLLETSIPGIFAAGDVRHGSIKRCATAVGEGSMAIAFAHQYPGELRAVSYRDGHVLDPAFDPLRKEPLPAAGGRQAALTRSFA
jgi:hypothetical protein